VGLPAAWNQTPAPVIGRGRAALAALAVALAGACGSGSTLASATARPRVVALVAQDPAALVGVEVMAGTATVPVPSDQLAAIAPLMSDRALADPEAPASYGLQPPPAVLDYQAKDGSTIVVALGHADFDHHFLYAQRAGDPSIYLIPSSPLRPVLALVGIKISPPT
jgi:hypothetical protein